eukprot:15361288-Alexandrium_andersonii.AAC.1
MCLPERSFAQPASQLQSRCPAKVLFLHVRAHFKAGLKMPAEETDNMLLPTMIRWHGVFCH